jgi:AP-2 complex subunit alpha
MPPFSERTSILLSRLHQKTAGTTERKTWVVGGKDANADKKEVLLAQTTGLKRSFTTIVNGTRTGSNGTPTPTSATSASGDLAGLDFSSGPTLPAPNLASAAHLTPDWDIGFNRLYYTPEGVLFEDAQIQVGLRSEYRGHMGVVKLYISNKSSYPITSLTTTVDNPAAPNLKIDTKNLPDSTVNAAAQTQQTLFCAVHGPFSDAPTIRISYLAGALQAYTLQLPVLMHRYMEPSGLSAEDFFKRWRQIGGDALEGQKTFGVTAKNKTATEGFTRRTVEGFGWKILDGVDPNAKNIVGCAVFQFEAGKTGCLMRLEPNYEKSVCFPSQYPFGVIKHKSHANILHRCIASPYALRRKVSHRHWSSRWSRSCPRERRRMGLRMINNRMAMIMHVYLNSSQYQRGFTDLSIVHSMCFALFSLHPDRGHLLVPLRPADSRIVDSFGVSLPRYLNG